MLILAIMLGSLLAMLISIGEGNVTQYLQDVYPLFPCTTWMCFQLLNLDMMRPTLIYM